MKHTENDVLNIFFEEIPGGGDVLLLVSPLVWTGSPLLSLHMLQAACRQAGITTQVFYSNLLYSIAIGRNLHSRIVLEEYLLLKDQLFASTAFNRSVLMNSIDKLSNPAWMPDYTWKINPNTANLRVPEELAPFREWVGTVDWEYLESLTRHWIQSISKRIANMGYRIVGCSTTFGGLVPAIALLDSIKKANANVITILGGALCEGEMAEGILSLKAGIDYVFSGEGELTFPDFVKKLMAGHLPGEKIIYGEPIMDMDTLPPPIYQDYFDQLYQLLLDQSQNFEVPYETSRGCWYGKCTFCSMNGENNFYREKSGDKVLDDLKELTAQHGVYTVFITDTMIPPSYYDTLLPRISKEIPSINLRHDIKSNLTLEQVLFLKKSGVSKIQAGIESLSPSLLKRMRKCATVRENIAFLRYIRSVRLNLNWFILYGFPGDEASEYEEMLHLLPLIHHLTPPRRMFPLIIFRFNEYRKFPEKYGISNLRPAEIYRDIFPLHTDLEKIAYCFTGDYLAQSSQHPQIIITLAKEFQAWKKVWEIYEEMVPLEMMLPTLHITKKKGNEYILEDTRGLPGMPKRRVLSRDQAGILLVARPQDSSVDFQWAVDAQLGVLMDRWFIPLATAEPELLQEFEHEYESVDRYIL